MRLLLLLTVVLALATSVHGLYFIAGPGEERCFYTTLTAGSAVMVEYSWTPDSQALRTRPNSPGNASANRQPEITITVTDAFGRELLSQLAHETGRVGFSAAHSGEFTTCVRIAGGGSWMRNRRRFRFSIDISADAGADDEPTDVADAARIAALSSTVRRVRDKVDQIQAEQLDAKAREARYSTLGDRASFRVVFFVVTSLLMYGAAAWYQMRKLQSFFRRRKIV
jgi:hypothetical protein